LYPLRLKGERRKEMVTITDFPTTTNPYWEVVDTTGKLGKVKFHYDPNCPIGYARVHVLKQIVDIYTILSDCKKQIWQIPGSIFTLS
jgi:hypothetical protein